MLKRLLLTLCVFGSVGLEAQVPRGRWSSVSTEVPVVVSPRITITTPTADQVFTTSETVIQVGGLAEAGSSPILRVFGSCATCSPTVFDATGRESWLTSSGSGPETKVQDTFTGPNTLPLATLEASPVGGVWTQIANTTAVSFFERNVSGHAKANTGGGNAHILLTVEPSTPIVGTNYDLSVRLNGVGSADGDDAAVLPFRVTDANNYCAVVWYGSGANPDLHLIKKVAGVITSFGTADINPAAGNVISLEVRGTGLTVKEDTVTRITATDTGGFCDDNNTVGLGLGSLRGVAGDDVATHWWFDDYTVIDQDSSQGSISLGVGVNVITFTVEAVSGAIATDIVTVTRQGADTVPPVVSFLLPAAGETHSTSNVSFAPSGPVSDNSGVAPTVSVACTNASPASVPATVTNGTWTVTGPFTLGGGLSTCTVTATDGNSNVGNDVLAVTYNAGDSTIPTITITSNGGSPITTAANPYALTGTAVDNLPSNITQVYGQCDRCVLGTVAGLTSWQVPLTLAPGANAVQMFAVDGSGNVSLADTIVITLSTALTITTQTPMPPATQGLSYQPQTLTRTGGTGSFTWDNNAGGTSLGGGACTGFSISTAGVVSGTGTTIGTCNFTARVTDSAPTSATKSLSFSVLDPSAEGPHDYFNTMIARGDCYRASSFRPQVGQPMGNQGMNVADCSKPHWERQLSANNGGALSTAITYPTLALDTHPNKQDAAKLAVPQFIQVGSPPNALASAIGPGEIMVPFNGTVALENRRSVRIGSEVMTVNLSVGTKVGNTWPMDRGQFGTTAASHASGALAALSVNGISTADQVRPRVETDGRISARYLYVVDMYYTDSFVNTGLTNHKSFQVSYHTSGNQYVETNAFYSGPDSDTPNPAWAASGGALSNVAAFQTRFYAQSTTPGAWQDGPGRPMANPPFIIKPKKWTRFWVEIEANAEDDASKFAALSGGRGLLSAAITDINATSISIDHAGINTNPFTVAQSLAGADTKAPFATWTGRAIKIDNEIMTLVSCSVCSGAQRTLTVVRGAQGTTKATHTLGTPVQLIEDYVTIWVADEDQLPVLQFDHVAWHIPINKSDVGFAGSMYDFWLEFNTSTSEIRQGRADAGFQDMIAYIRNFVVLKNPPADWSALRVRPVR